MMRAFRNALYFSLGVMIALVWGMSQARAETVAATRVLTSPITQTTYRTGGLAHTDSTVSNAASCAKVTPTDIQNAVSGWGHCSSGCNQYGASPSYVSGATCYAYFWSVKYAAWYTVGFGINSTSAGVCPANSVAEGSECAVYSCPTTGGWSLSVKSCIRPDCPEGTTRDPATGACPCSTGTVNGVTGVSVRSGAGVTYVGNLPPRTVCYGACAYTTQGTGAVVNGTWFSFVGQGLGQTCQEAASLSPTSATNDTPQSEESKCLASGQSFGYALGKVVCVPKTDPGAATTSTTQPPKSSESKDSTGATTEKTNTTEQTICQAGACNTTTTTTSTNGAGQTTGTKTETTPGDGTEQGEYCAKNPTAPACVKSAWGGGCGAFTCSGDAVQCAMAKEVHEKNCKLLADKPGASAASAESWYASNAGGEGLKVSGEGGIKSSASAPTIESNARFLGAGGLDDLSVQIMGKTITIPFSKLVAVLGYMGLALQAVALMIAARIFHGGLM